MNAPVDPVQKIALEIVDRDGSCTAEALVEAARSEGSPIHDRFEWDDSIAGQLYRLDQARALLRTVRIIRDPEANVERMVAVTVKRDVGLSEVRGYMPASQATSRAEWRDQMIREAVMGIRGWTKRLADLKETVKLAAVIDEAIDEHAPRIGGEA